MLIKHVFAYRPLRRFPQINGSSQSSGAYIFRPASETPLPAYNGAVGVTMVTGPVLSEFQSMYGYVTQSTRLWTGAEAAEIEWTVGPVDVSDGNGHEVCGSACSRACLPCIGRCRDSPSHHVPPRLFCSHLPHYLSCCR